MVQQSKRSICQEACAQTEINQQDPIVSQWTTRRGTFYRKAGVVFRGLLHHARKTPKVTRASGRKRHSYHQRWSIRGWTVRRRDSHRFVRCAAAWDVAKSFHAITKDGPPQRLHLDQKPHQRPSQQNSKKGFTYRAQTQELKAPHRESAPETPDGGV